MIITKTCNTCEHSPNDQHCVGCEWDKSKGENSKWELLKNPIVIERAVLDKIRAEIEQLATKYNPPKTPYDGGYTMAIVDVLRVIKELTKGEQE